MEEGTIDNIKFSILSPEPKQKAFEVLKSWLYKGRTSTYRQLAQALKEEDKGNLVNKYCIQQVILRKILTFRVTFNEAVWGKCEERK